MWYDLSDDTNILISELCNKKVRKITLNGVLPLTCPLPLHYPPSTPPKENRQNSWVLKINEF